MKTYRDHIRKIKVCGDLVCERIQIYIDTIPGIICVGIFCYNNEWITKMLYYSGTDNRRYYYFYRGSYNYLEFEKKLHEYLNVNDEP